MRARDCAVEAAGAGNAGVPVGTGGTHRLNCTYGTGSASGTTIHGDPNGMVLHEQFHCALKYLTGADNRKLAALAQARSFAKEAVIVGLGPSRRGLYLLTSGVACMVRSHLGQDTVLTPILFT